MKLNPSIKNMSNEYIFFTDQTALTFRICLVKDCILKCEHNIHCINIQTKSVYCDGDYDIQKNPPLTLIMRLT